MNWICDCPEGFIIPPEYSICRKCKKYQTRGLLGERREVRYGKIYVPRSFEPSTDPYCSECENYHAVKKEVPYIKPKVKKVITQEEALHRKLHYQKRGEYFLNGVSHQNL